jgi:hypothetical protein
VRRSRVVKDGEIERAVCLLGTRVGDNGAILVLLDADDACAATLGPTLLARARAARPDRRIGVVLAVREYEAWLLASIESLGGARGLPKDAIFGGAVENMSSPKAKLDAMLPHGYAETTDQAALTARIDVATARARSPSFDKLVREVEKLASSP